MAHTLEAPQKANWADYMNDMGKLAAQGDWNQLESLLAEDHPVLPGEREAFEMLEEHHLVDLDRPLLVELDESGHHVVPKNSVD